MTPRLEHDQVILPNRVALRICVRGLRSRLGRSMITLTGVALGTAFLMAVTCDAIVRNALAEQIATRQEVNRRVVLLQGQIGHRPNARLEVLVADPSPAELEFMAVLKRGHDAVIISGSTAAGHSESPVDALVCLGHYAPLLRRRLAESPVAAPILAFETPPPDLDAVRSLPLALPPDQAARAASQGREQRYRMIWILGAALLIMTISIANAMLMSVTERFREIGTMKCLGALSGFVVRLFLIECALIGVSGALLGAGAGAVFALAGHVYLHGVREVVRTAPVASMALAMAVCVVVGVILATIAGIYPARVAARMTPASALASHV